MIVNIQHTDTKILSQIISESILFSVLKNGIQAQVLIDETIESLVKWLSAGSNGYSGKFIEDKSIVGFIVVKDYWNLSHLFVLPSFQKKGIGKALLSEAILKCKDTNPKRKIMLNSSNSASAFYKHMGFINTGGERALPGGCIPYEYNF
jgi:GNAT superfamily N-acetyltransferase